MPIRDARANIERSDSRTDLQTRQHMQHKKMTPLLDYYVDVLVIQIDASSA
jgi:hypothetical protein